MSDRPAGHLKCVGYQFRLYDGNPIEHYVFDDGSTWICRNGTSWSLDWNPEPIVTREPHCCEVEIHLRNETIRHYKDRIAELEAELAAIKARPQEVPPWGAAAGRVAKLERQKRVAMDVCKKHFKSILELEAELDATKAELAAAKQRIVEWEDAASTELESREEDIVLRCNSPKELIDRLKHLYCWATAMERRVTEDQRRYETKLAAMREEVAEWETIAKRICPNHQEVRPSDIERKVNDLKSAPAEVPPLDETRVFAIAESIASRHENRSTDIENRFWRSVRESFKCAKFQVDGHGVAPYKIK